MNRMIIAFIHLDCNKLINMRQGRSCYMATLGNNGFILYCSLFLAGYLVHGTTPYDYSATIECLKQPLDPQYGGGLIANPCFDKGIEAWKVDGHVKIETRESGGNKFLVAYNRTTPYSVSQSFHLKEGLYYAFSAWVQLSEGSDIVVAMIYDTDEKTVTTVGSVIAKSGCWSMIKGGLTVDHNAPSVLHFQSNNTKSELMVDSVSLKEFTKHEWQENRLKNTEKVRKRTLRVNVSNKDGNKIGGAKIKIQQRKLQFVIGCATPSSILMSESYQKWFVSRFTTAVFDNEMKWYYVEGLKGHENYSTPDAMLKFFEDHGIDVRGHNILWGADNIQRWLKKLPPRQFLSESIRRMGSVMSRYAGKLVAWDVVNENLHHPLFEERLGKNASAIFYKIASSLDSRATMFLNEFNTLEHPGDMVSIPSKYVQKLQEIKAFPGNEELVIGIGLQGHFDSHPNIPYVRAVFDVLGETKMPIWLTELNVKPCSNQAYYLEEIMREAFAHPAVKGMMIWIGWKPDRCNEMCLLNYKLENSPSGDVVDKLFAEWKTTNLTGVTDKEGSFEVKVFHGDYDVTVYNPNTGANVTKEVQVYDDKSETLDVSISL
ncbi:endo-1,4-beta-xylanase 5-like isoform X1 [Solanum dulcamara]|uniref:endo-1,4-beta-xylanase 5-like isoform X1 n=2 Tax=Solanum dulcamara TaxID=45834 RepID=UPI002485EE6E|nr:endo-1,4-beta-xylanase 5-like isoform X1 [Solanum dulcamara]